MRVQPADAIGDLGDAIGGAVGDATEAISRSSVLFPAPFSPRSDHRSFGIMVQSTASMSGELPAQTSKSRMAMAAPPPSSCIRGPRKARSIRPLAKTS